ncbi:hypothetical protein JNUCC1_02673 [Lentibacillus sp. JNUCC-1]|nr:hypothetical protein [Lentibacillus sp. JNUCC-1]MUV38802.1 hypothetical protein [Lentibacillus sp. JNUCC-1]
MSDQQNKKQKLKLTNKDKENIKKHLKKDSDKSVSEKYFEENEKKRWI